MKKIFFGKIIPVWFIILFIIAAGSLAASGLSPVLVKKGEVKAVVAERIVIDAVNPLPDADEGNAETIVPVGTEGFQWIFQIHVGERAKASVRIMNDGNLGTVAKFVCLPPDGIEFTIIQDTGIGANKVMRVDQNEFAAFIPGALQATQQGINNFADFILVVKGLQEGQFRMSCFIFEAWSAADNAVSSSNDPNRSTITSTVSSSVTSNPPK